MAHNSIIDRLVKSVAIAVSCCMIIGCGHEPVSIILEYEVDRDAMHDETPPDMDRLAAAMNARLLRSGQASATKNGNIEVALFGKVDENYLTRIERYMSTQGLVEFRIVASPVFTEHRQIIEIANTLPPGEKDVYLGDQKVAEWMVYDVDKFGPVLDLVIRTAGDTPQALILTNDGYNVRGDNLNRVKSGFDEKGRPNIRFSFDKLGSLNFGKLTGEHIPNPSGEEYHLGIIFDKQLLSAPSIRQKITGQGTISGGGMTQDEVDFTVGILNAGSLPYPIRQVSKRSIIK